METVNRPKIALVYGGYSSEAGISRQSGKNVAAHIDRSRYDVYEVSLSRDGWYADLPEGGRAEVDKSDFSFVRAGGKVRFDAAYIIIHGAPGENGQLQAYFDMIGLPYTGCNALVSTVAFDKYACKCYLRDTGVALAPDLLLHRGDAWTPEEVTARLGLPVFVKPNDGGSSFGITKVKRSEDLEAAVARAFGEGDSVLLEAFIPGRELTEGVYFDGREAVALPVTEIVTDREYFDYEAKYLGESREICPAPIPAEIRDRVQETSRRIFRHFGSRGLMRIDYIFDGKELYFLEINPIPGMTGASLVPVQLREAGIALETFTDQLIQNALCRR